VPQSLGLPRHWTLPVHIVDQAIFQFDLPFAAALATILLIASALCIALIYRQGRRGEHQS
jgi:putative spermidine/putrescine transport system permease protein